MAANQIPSAPVTTDFQRNGRITQPWRAWLDAITATGATVAGLTGDYLSRALNLSDLASPSIARGNLGLSSAATHPASDFLATASNLSDVASVATARTNLGLDTAATQPSTAFDAAGAAAAAQAASLQIASNLSDVASAGTARTNLGLGSGLSVTVALAKITPTTGTNGSLTFVNGILTAKVDPT